MSSIVIKAIKTLPKITIKKPQAGIDDVCKAVTNTAKPAKPQITINTTPTSQVSGTDILASNNRAMPGRNVQTLNIRGVSSANPYCLEYSRLCNSSNFTIEEAQLLAKTF